MKVGGQILLNVTPICETSQIYFLMGRRPMKDVLGNHLMDRLFRFVLGLSITYNCERPVKNPSIGKKVLPRLFLGYALYAGGIWKGDVLIADLEELETMDASEIYSKRLNAKEVIFSKEGEFIFPIADGRIKTPWRRSGTENIHLDTAATNSGRKSPWFSWRIRRVSSTTTSRLASRCRWSDKCLLVHVRKLHIPPSRWT